jgi:hypothetical protein
LVLIVRATKKLLRLTGPATALNQDRGSTLLGPWFATVLFWRLRVALLVNESTLLPVLLPLAPVSTLTSRVAEQVTTVLTAHYVPAAIIDQERRNMQTCQVGMTTNRSVVGVMTEFARLSEIHHDDDPAVDLVELAVRLAATPCGPCTTETPARIVNSPPPCKRWQPDRRVHDDAPSVHPQGHIAHYANHTRPRNIWFAGDLPNPA